MKLFASVILLAGVLAAQAPPLGIAGRAELWFDPRDPLREGFILR